MSATVAERRLPEVRVERPSRQADEGMSRMDIASFIGFAQKGPLNTPVAIEDMGQFDAVFGGEVALPPTDKNAHPVGHLRPSVDFFFANGGKRCWIIRVAGNEAESAVFEVPGIVGIDFDPAGTTFAPAIAIARSPGPWADTLRVKTRLHAKRIKASWSIASSPPGSLTISLAENADLDLQSGDVIRLAHSDAASPSSSPGRAYFLAVVHSLTSPDEDSGFKRTINIRQWVAVRNVQADDARLNYPYTSVSLLGTGFPVMALWQSPPEPLQVDTHGNLSFKVHADTSAALLRPGSPLLLSRDSGVSTDQLLVFAKVCYASGEDELSINGPGYWVSNEKPSEGFTDPPGIAEILRFDLAISEEDKREIIVENLSMNAPHTRYWGRMPDDDLFYANEDLLFRTRKVDRNDLALARALGTIDGHRIPLAGTISTADGFAWQQTGGHVDYFPIGMILFFGNTAGPLPTSRSIYERAGLKNFTEELFVDARLKNCGCAALIEQANYYFHGDTRPAPLKGMHAIVPIEEASIIAVPDATHTPWEYGSTSVLSARIITDNGHTAPECHDSASTAPAPIKINLGDFFNCSDRAKPPAPVLEARFGRAGSCEITLSWKPVVNNVRYTLEQTRRCDQLGEPDFINDIVIFEGIVSTDPMTFAVSYDAAEIGVTGDYYYRVSLRAEEFSPQPLDSSPDSGSEIASNSLQIRVSSSQTVSALPGDAAMMAIHHKLLELCCARGDLFAVLSLQRDARELEAMEYVGNLRRSCRPAGIEHVGNDCFDDIRSPELSYGAVYHPWCGKKGLGKSAVPGIVPPDGICCGVMARRANERGAWVAPANVPLSGIFMLSPDLRRSQRLDLYTARINQLWDEPRGFLCMNASTLSSDPDLSEINVRRLLIFLRRLALYHGATFVFEPNSERFRRMIQTAFEELLRGLFARGAFTGSRPEEAFQVVVNGEDNPAQAIDEGRLVVELRVAPSFPLRFLTVILVQTGGSLTVSEG